MSTPNDELCAEHFFESTYKLLRDQPPMRWMRRLFERLTEGWHPNLIDLPTGAAKTDVTVIWILALAWYGLERGSRRPVPRRLVWVVNRRVLVQQVFRLARQLEAKLSAGNCELSELRKGLVSLSGDPAGIFRVVQLRGQLVDDREWSVVPAVPQLIIGTVDQIGSRLLFQGYGLGKWSRPLQAALLAVDAWICVDEAHLVPEFLLTLRQARRFIEEADRDIPAALSAAFEHLPFWATELSATPSLPPPNADSIFRLIPDDEGDPRLLDRLIAAQTRQVKIRWITANEKLDQVIGAEAAALGQGNQNIAVFVREPSLANKIKKHLQKQFKDRVLTITGRLRGYERDRIEKHPVFIRFRPPEEGEEAGEIKESVFLVGTAAAEVGLDADASAVLCDFASLPTLLQRLGRLDRRGRLSQRFRAGQCGAPTMTIFVKPDVPPRDIRRRMIQLARALRAELLDENVPSASFLVGAHWNMATSKQAGINANGAGADNADENEAGGNGGKKPKRLDPAELVGAATLRVLLGGHFDQQGVVDARSPTSWLKHRLAPVTGGPVAVPVLTSSQIEHWSATTSPQNDFTPVHPFLYGILPDEEGTPLIGVAFRLEMDGLAASRPEDEDESDEQSIRVRVEEIFTMFPPCRAELHYVPISAARTWLESPEASKIPVAVFDGEEWRVALDRNSEFILKPDAILVLPTLARGHHTLNELLEDTGDVATCDVLEGVSTQRPSYWRQVKEVHPGDYRLTSGDGASRIEPVNTAVESQPPGRASVGDRPPDPPAGKVWRPCVSQTFDVGTARFRFVYHKVKNLVQSPQFLNDHLRRAEEVGGRIAETVAPGSEFLRSLISEASSVHDLGKNNPKWQAAMGNRDLENPVAKPLVAQPARMGGFRHEWESLLRVTSGQLPNLPPKLSDSEKQIWIDLWRHLIASHHGHVRPWLADHILEKHPYSKQRQSAIRIESAERFSRLQRLLGPWRLAYLEALVKAADTAASRADEEDDANEQ
ncbi:MAG: type I-U CRISPR-associated helicase/endonuclease Cas3 [Bacillota bacterium]|nr:type I-U CRISPR-associated helicase/endonuclease Cas3 [Bacillota bacterium]